jgi:adenylate cyclase, class 2
MQQDKPAMEAECKYRVSRLEDTRRALLELAAVLVGIESQCDTYLRHPSRDFRETDEALRIREVDGNPFVTYKGRRLVGPIKIRPEIELPLTSGTVQDWLRIWDHLGFTIAQQVRKRREVFHLNFRGQAITIALDQVEALGEFVEIERIVTTASEIEQAKQDIQELASLLGLTVVEPRSYLGMLLQDKQ